MTDRSVRAASLLASAAALFLVPGSAAALPRYAARNSMECIQCHYDPTGGGVRNRYGSGVYTQTLLPIGGSSAPEDGAAHADNDWLPRFDGMLTEWLTLGADVRLAYILAAPRNGTAPTNTFFLMQADLYHAATLNPHVNLIVDVGVYTGFEAWVLVKANAASTPLNLMLKAGRFKPAFGVRESNHTIFTRETVGFGPMDQDSGLELMLYAYSLTIDVGLVNGTLGNQLFDTFGTVRRKFEKAVYSRSSLKIPLDPLHLQIGGSVYWNNNVDRQNPIFDESIAADMMTDVAMGVDELRADAFLMANLGRVSYIADAVYVRDTFNSTNISTLDGDATYQELSFLPFQGLDLIATLETKNGNLSAPGHRAVRAGFVAELFPFAFCAVRVMARERFVDAPNPNITDLVVFLHAFL